MKRMVAQLACLVLVFSFSAFAQAQRDNSQTPHQASQESTFERQFIKQAAQGNMAEIKLANLAEQKATDPQVKELARTIAQDHKDNQKKLEDVAQSQNISLPSQVPQKMSNEQQKLSSLSGQQFDHAYVQMMIQEHKTDINKFQKAEKMASDQSVKQYAQETVPVLKKHLQMAEQAAGQAPSTQAQE